MNGAWRKIQQHDLKIKSEKWDQCHVQGAEQSNLKYCRYSYFCEPGSSLYLRDITTAFCIDPGLINTTIFRCYNKCVSLTNQVKIVSELRLALVVTSLCLLTRDYRFDFWMVHPKKSGPGWCNYYRCHPLPFLSLKKKKKSSKFRCMHIWATCQLFNCTFVCIILIRNPYWNN